jgi:hypothetical protein
VCEFEVGFATWIESGSEYNTAATPFPLLKGEQSGSGCGLENIIHAFSSQRRTFEVFPSSNVVCNICCLLAAHKVL